MSAQENLLPKNELEEELTTYKSTYNAPKLQGEDLVYQDCDTVSQ